MDEQPLLFKVLLAQKCNGTHHKLAVEALRHLQCGNADRWRDLCLTNIEAYLKGSKAPDDEFKDFKNHVLHVKDGFWGGAPATARKWYDKTVLLFREQKWSQGVFAAGVLTHYVSDPFQPLHTGQSEAEGPIHRACEWSISKSYDRLSQSLEQELGGYPQVEAGGGPDWLENLIRAGATAAYPHYQVCLDHYDLKRGVKVPEEGLDQELQDRMARQIGLTVKSIAVVLDRLFSECQQVPSTAPVTLYGVLSAMTTPLFWVTRKLADAKDRAVVSAIYDEFQKRGKVIDALPDDEKLVRRLHAEEVLKQPLAELDAQPIPALGQAYGTGASKRDVRVTPKEPVAPVVARQPLDVRQNIVEPVTSAVVSSDATRELAAFLAPFQEQQIPVTETEAVHDTGMERLLAHELTVKTEEPDAMATGLSLFAPGDGANRAETREPIAEHQELVAPSEFNQERSCEPLAASGPRVTRESPLVDAPSIGPKSAERFAKIGVMTIGDFLDGDATQMGAELGRRGYEAPILITWQRQAQLMIDVPGLNCRAVQMLVGVGIETQPELASTDLATLSEVIQEFGASSEGQRILRDADIPDDEQIRGWIDAGQRAGQNRNAA